MLVKIRTEFVIVVMESVTNAVRYMINSVTESAMDVSHIRIVIMKLLHQKQNCQMKKASPPEQKAIMATEERFIKEVIIKKRLRNIPQAFNHYYWFKSVSSADSFRLMVRTSIAFSNSSTGGRLGAIRRWLSLGLLP